MGVWKPSDSHQRYAIAISNYHSQAGVSHQLDLTVGDTLCIYEESQQWYLGCHSTDRNTFGIFPKSYVVTKEFIIARQGLEDVMLAKELPMVHEVTTVLRDWGQLWKQLYVSRNPLAPVIHGMLFELIDWRSQLMSGKLPLDEIRELKQKIASKIDQGNAILGLDLVVRDEQGNLLNTESNSVIKLFREHKKASIQIKQAIQGSDSIISTSPVQSFEHSLYLCLNNFVCCVRDDSDLLLSLYDAKSENFFSENYVVHWGRQGFVKDLNQLNQLKVLFTDLGHKDLDREKVYLVCQVVRIGAMEIREGTLKKNTLSKRVTEGLRRPFGVAVMDITDVMSGRVDSDEDKQYFVPFVQCTEKEYMFNLVKSLTSGKEKKSGNQEEGLWVSLKMLHGEAKHIRQQYPHIVSYMTSKARKIGFPDIILPGDVRNDLYLTLEEGDFSRTSKSSERNIEIVVKVCDESGKSLERVISPGTGVEPVADYRSLVYYHQDKPEWMETFKISVSIDDFYGAHLKFIFRHRSTAENKDKYERPFAISYIRLMNENGTTINDQSHDLMVYKIDQKRYDESDVSYLKLPSTRTEYAAKISEIQSAQTNGKQMKQQFQLPGLSLNTKDSFHISSVICSTKLTQNIDLLGLLKWRENSDNLECYLRALMNVEGEDVVKFLQDTLDALFNILMENYDTDKYDQLVFEDLIFIIGLISDRKYHHFTPILDVYIKETFSAPLAYGKLISVLSKTVKNARNEMTVNHDLLLKSMKSLEYLFKFIVRSRVLFTSLNGQMDENEFEGSLLGLVQSLASLMRSESDSLILAQAACIKYLPNAIGDIILVFNGSLLSSVLIGMITNMPLGRLTKQRLICIGDIVHSPLFKREDCREILVPTIADHLRELLETMEEMELAIKVLSDILIILNGADVGSTQLNISQIVMILLRCVIQTVIHVNRKNSEMAISLVAVLVSILKQMTPFHFTQYLDHFSDKDELMDFLMEILLVFRDLVQQPLFPVDWSDMIYLQNNVILESMRKFALCIRANFLAPFGQQEHQLWNNYFHCGIAYLTQEPLQLEKFSKNKRNKILSRYRDMRRDAATDIRTMWFALGDSKICFIPEIIGPFLEMSLIPDTELRTATLPIFFDQMLTEYYSSKETQSIYSTISDELGSSDPSDYRANFDTFSREIITKLDVLIEGGEGDEGFKEQFVSTMASLCETHPELHDCGIAFVRTVSRLLRRLLEYRAVLVDENRDNQMSCTVNLLEFYHEIGRQELYIRYLYKLCDIHVECDNFVEAGYSLLLHARLLNWSDETLTPILKNNKYPYAETHRELKELLYTDVIDYFNRGGLWEVGVTLCKELIIQYETEVYDYHQLSLLLTRLASFYGKIMTAVRPEPEYFRVGYFGKGFPSFLANKTFIYRGRECELLSDFNARLMNNFPNAQLMTSLDPPGDPILESNEQYLQINKVTPIMSDKDKFKGKQVHDQIVKYYRVNQVQKFSFSRPVRKSSGEVGGSENEFRDMWIERTTLTTNYPLPGILRWFQVTLFDVHELSPIENAIETMEVTNNRIKETIISHREDENAPVNQLSMLLSGTVEAAVMGGVGNYEKAFFAPDYIENHSSPRDQEFISRLKELIACQVPLLEIGLLLHKERIPDSLKPFQEHLDQKFEKLKADLVSKYGKQSPPSELSAPRIRRTPAVRNFTRKPQLNGNSDPNRKSDRNLSIHPRTTSVSEGKSRPSFSLFVKNNCNSIGSHTNLNSIANASIFSANTLGKLIKQTSKENANQLRKSLGEASQFYTDGGNNGISKILESKSEDKLVELTETLKSQRPARPDPEKRFSRPGSGSFRTCPSPNRTTFGSSQFSISSSFTSEQFDEFDSPPPIPTKQSVSEYSNFNNSQSSYADLTLTSPKRNTVSMNKSRPPPPIPGSPSSSIGNLSNSEPPELPKRPARHVYKKN